MSIRFSTRRSEVPAGLVVAGYQFVGETVVGNCSYYTVTSGSGKGGGYHSTTTYYNQTCTWDLYGNLLTVAAGAPAVPTPPYVNGTQTVYAMNNNGGTTGSDSALAGHGFVNTLGSHYTWTTSNAYMVLNTTPYTFTATLAATATFRSIFRRQMSARLRAKRRW